MADLLLGADGADLDWWQMGARALVVFVAGIALLRVGGLRILGPQTAFDLLVAVILGSVLARAVTGATSVHGALAASTAIVVAHRAFALLAMRSHRFGILVKGREQLLVRDGEIDWKSMHRSAISEHDLRAAIRLKAATEDLASVAQARLERTGEISVLLRS